MSLGEKRATHVGRTAACRGCTPSAASIAATIATTGCAQQPHWTHVGEHCVAASDVFSLSPQGSGRINPLTPDVQTANRATMRRNSTRRTDVQVYHHYWRNWRCVQPSSLG